MRRLRGTALAYAALFSQAALAAPDVARLEVVRPEQPPFRVVDGDTYWFPRERIRGFPAQFKVRLYGANAPETRGRCPAESELAARAKAFAQERMAAAKSIRVEFVSLDKYARVDARVTLDGRDLAQDMVAAGLARPYAGGARDPQEWCKQPPATAKERK